MWCSLQLSPSTQYSTEGMNAALIKLDAMDTSCDWSNKLQGLGAAVSAVTSAAASVATAAAAPVTASTSSGNIQLDHIFANICVAQLINKTPIHI